jgi:lipid-A-disaccharide synthase
MALAAPPAILSPCRTQARSLGGALGGLCDTGGAQMQQTILMVAGEASADAHGAKVLEAMADCGTNVHAVGIGGAAMRAQGFEAIVPAEAMSLAGLTEVLWALPRMWRTMRALEALARERRPCVALLLDLPDFNLRLAKRLKALGIPVVYYISPQVWAWRARRVQQIRRLVDQMLVILPFEKAFYEAHRVPVQFVGHPLVEQLSILPNAAAARRQLGLTAAPAPVIALLPGSRRKEVLRHLPVMLAGLRLARQKRPALQAVLPIASTIDVAWVAQMVADSGVAVTLAPGAATDALVAADAAVVCSGTATLQAALLLRPMVVVYKVSWLSYQILRRLIKVAHIALVNLIAGEALVPELVQGALTPAHVARHIDSLLRPGVVRQGIVRRLAALRSELGQHKTSLTVAQAVLAYIPHPLPMAKTPRL